MKYTCLITALLCGLTLNAAVIEPFDYSAGSLDGVAATGAGLSGNWSVASIHQIASGSLSAIPGYGFTPTGNRLSMTPAGGWGSATVSLDSGNTIDWGGDGTTYFSFLADFGTAGAIFQINFEDASDSSVSANVADGNG